LGALGLVFEALQKKKKENRDVDCVENCKKIKTKTVMDRV